MRSSGAPVSVAAGFPRRAASRRPLNANVRVAVRTLSFYAAILGTVAWLVLSYGGMGGLGYLGLITENFLGQGVGWVTIPIWSLSVLLLVLWWSTPAAMLMRARYIRHWIIHFSGTHPLTAGEWIIIGGHLLLLLAGANALLYPGVLKYEFVYGLLLLAAVAYSLGLLTATLTARSTRTPIGAPPIGAG
jgi:hypothetical protein